MLHMQDVQVRKGSVQNTTKSHDSLLRLYTRQRSNENIQSEQKLKCLRIQMLTSMKISKLTTGPLRLVIAVPSVTWY